VIVDGVHPGGEVGQGVAQRPLLEIAEDLVAEGDRIRIAKAREVERSRSWSATPGSERRPNLVEMEVRGERRGDLEGLTVSDVAGPEEDAERDRGQSPQLEILADLASR
jgi:hypothetical protein